MKGLLIKDFMLLKNQKSFFIIIVAAAIGLSTLMENSSFIIGYIAVIGSLFTLSTIRYDEFDNGNAFLYTLPITRKDYVYEKYEFGLFTSGISLLAATVIAMIADLIKHSVVLTDTIVTALLTLPVSIILISFMLPFHLKFEGEKSKYASIGAIGLIYVICFAFVKIAELFDIDLITTFNQFFTMRTMGTLIALAFGIGIIICLISIKISINIIHKKDF